MLRTALMVANATKNLIKTAREIGLAPPAEPVDRARKASGSQRQSRSASLWRTELTVSLATQDMCQLAKMCSDAISDEFAQPNSIDVFGTSTRLIPAKERLLAAVRRVAAASAQLLMSAKSRKLVCATADVHKLQVAGQAVKEATDKLSTALHQGHFSCDSTGLYVTAPLSPALQNVIETQARIRSQQSELNALERHLVQLHEEQVRSHPDLFDQTQPEQPPRKVELV